MALSPVKFIPLKGKKITSWSISRLKCWEECPRKAYYKFIEKRTEPGSVAMERGNTIHKLAENYLKGGMARLPKELNHFTDHFKDTKGAFKKQTFPVTVETTWGFDKDWKEVAWNDWNNCVLRVKLDLGIFTSSTVYKPVDYKTGRFDERKNADYIDQLDLYGTATLYKFPEIKALEVRPELYYLDHGIIYPPAGKPIIYGQKDSKRMKSAWDKRARPMLNDAKFLATPNRGCSWCHFRRSNSGPCEY